MSKRPFEHLKKPLHANAPATTHYVERRLRETLGKLHFTGDAIKAGGADGQIHIEFSSVDAGDYPFKPKTFVAASNGRTGVTIMPGLVYSNAFRDSPWLVPVIGGRSLLADPPPALAPNGTQSFICLVAEFDFDGSAYNMPWKIEAFGTPPQNTPLIRYNSASGDPQRGIYYILIATVEDSTLYSWVRRNISINLQWEVPFISA